MVKHLIDWVIFFLEQHSRIDKFNPTSKKYFHLGAMALSEWTRILRAVRDTPVADNSTPGVNSTRRISYCPLIAVSRVLLVLSVTYFKRSLWGCGQL